MIKTTWTPAEALELMLAAKGGSNFLDVVFEVAMFSGPEESGHGDWIESVRSNDAQTKIIATYLETNPRSSDKKREVTLFPNDWTTRLDIAIRYMRGSFSELRAGIFTRGLNTGKCTALLMRGSEPILSNEHAATEALAMCAAMLSARIAGRI